MRKGRHKRECKKSEKGRDKRVINAKKAKRGEAREKITKNAKVKRQKKG